MLSPAVLSQQFRALLEQEAGEPVEILNAPEVRRLGPSQLLRLFRSYRGQRCLLAVEDEGSLVLVPMLEALACAMGPSSIAIVRQDMSFSPIARSAAAWSAFAVLAATVDAPRVMRSAKRELAALRASPRLEMHRGPGRRVLFVNGNLWFGLRAGGSVGHVAGVVNGLTDAGYDVSMVSTVDPLMVRAPIRFHKLHAPVFGLPIETNYYRFNNVVLKEAEAEATTSRPAFVYQRASVGNYSGVGISRRLRLPLVLEYNGSEVWAARHWGRPLRYERLACDVEDVNLQHAQVVVVVSSVLRDEVLERGVDLDRIAMYPNCVDPSVFDPERFSEDDRAAARRRVEVPDGGVAVVFLGTFGHWHGVDVLARAIVKLAESRRSLLVEAGVRFVLVGDGLKMPEVCEILERGAATQFVTLTGLVPQADAPRMLLAADVLVSPHVPNPDGSSFFGSPTKLFEYMAMARPIVASRLNQIQDVLAPSADVRRVAAGNPGPNERLLGLLVEPRDVGELSDAVALLVERPAWREQLGRAARAEVLERYTWRHHVSAILERVNDRLESDTPRS